MTRWCRPAPPEILGTPTEGTLKHRRRVCMLDNGLVHVDHGGLHSDFGEVSVQEERAPLYHVPSCGSESLHPFSPGADSELLVGFEVGEYEDIWRTSKIRPRLLRRCSPVYFPDES
ncbi:hypothetical protein Cfor_10071 [Coptotermes formosanus]|uniref:Uncharacterized protein n=1 Tax=Coptotermes formosanus TaxID=36987 RepID=A0A6L2PAN3_COPFO|nr:hypothetical protein Cfor_10071 [Coptotermes formosanus]